MVNKNSGDDDGVEPRGTEAWGPPAIAWEEDLDVRADLALACGKSYPGQLPTCNAGTLSS